MKLQQKKKLGSCCCLCGENDPAVLDCHRINPGSKYTDWGTIIVCACCHRKIHDDQIIIEGKYKSTKGPVICAIIDGEEKWIEV